MKYDYRNAPRNTKLWAYAFQYHSAKESFGLKKKPVMGEIVDAKCHHNSLDEFTEYGKNNTLKKTFVYANSRQYTDAYEEAVEGYNELVEMWVEYFKKKIAETESYKLEIKNTEEE